MQIGENGPAFWHIKPRGPQGRPELAMRLLHQPTRRDEAFDEAVGATRVVDEQEPHGWLQSAGRNYHKRGFRALRDGLNGDAQSRHRIGI
jgi:hypothetical protein